MNATYSIGRKGANITVEHRLAHVPLEDGLENVDTLLVCQATHKRDHGYILILPMSPTHTPFP